MLDVLSSSPMSRAMGLALLHFLWQGAAIGGATAWLLHDLREGSPRARYLVGCLALLAMAVAPVVTTMSGLSDPVTVSYHPGAPDVARLDDATLLPTTAAPLAVQSTGTLPGLGAVSSVRGALTRALPLVVLCWALGVLVLTLQLAGSWMVVRRLRQTAIPVGEQWCQRTARLAGRLGITRVIAVSESMLVDVPTLIGWMRPVILIPTSVLTGLRPAELEAILTHELAHIRRHDYLVNVLQSVIETLLFYHPAVWWVSHRVRVEREHCCDDVAVAVWPDRVVYARALTSLEELRIRTSPLVLAATGGDLLGRIRRVLGTATIDEPRSSAWSALTVVLAILPIIVVARATDRAGQATPETKADVHVAQAVELPLTVTVAPDLLPPISRALPVRIVEPDSPLASPAGLAPIEGLVPISLVTPEPDGQIQTPASASRDQAAVLALEEQFRLAKVKADLAALDRLYDPTVIATNQNGNTRNKQQLLELWGTFRINLLTLDSAEVQISGDLAIVTGRQTELNSTGTDRMLFTRIWRRAGDTWRLISKTQFRDPREGEGSARAYPGIRMLTPPQTFQLRYEVFKNDALLGGTTLVVTTARGSSIEIPGEPAVGVSATAVQSDQVTVRIVPGVPGTSPAEVMPRGTDPVETSWTSGANTYRLRIWRGL